MSNKVGIRKQPVTATYVGALIFFVKISENYCEMVQTKSLVLQTKSSIKKSHMGTFALTQRPVPLFAYVLTLMEPPFPLSVNVIIEGPLLSSCIVPYCLLSSTSKNKDLKRISKSATNVVLVMKFLWTSKFPVSK